MFRFEYLSFALILAISLFFDLYTILFVISLLVASYFNFGLETNFNNQNKIDEKHGINKNRSSRLGGIIILFFFIINILINNNVYLIIDDTDKLTFFIIVILFISFLGFADDLLSGLNYLIKLYFLLFSILILIFTNNEFLVSSSGIGFLDYFLNNYVISFIITFFIISGFINASNISDGANGILSGVASAFSIVLFLHTNELVFLIFFKFIFMFFLYNILISNVFLGDTGSYFLGFLISTISLYYYNVGFISAGFFACILSYPCLEITFSIFRRLRIGTNPFKPDNKHLHNLIFSYLKKVLINFRYANSLTGLLINCIFVLPSLIYYLFSLDINTIFYWYIFVFQIIFYIVIYMFTFNTSHKT